MTTVEEFFDDMCKQFLNPLMIRYINMASFRSEFINQTYELIEFTRNLLEKNNVCRLDHLDMNTYYDYVSKKPKIAFWFNQNGKLDYTVDGYYYCLDKFIEIMANKQQCF